MIRVPWLVIAFLGSLLALVVVAVADGPGAAQQLDLHTIVLVLGAAVAGAQKPIGPPPSRR